MERERGRVERLLINHSYYLPVPSSSRFLLHLFAQFSSLSVISLLTRKTLLLGKGEREGREGYGNVSLSVCLLLLSDHSFHRSLIRMEHQDNFRAKFDLV